MFSLYTREAGAGSVGQGSLLLPSAAARSQRCKVCAGHSCSLLLCSRLPLCSPLPLYSPLRLCSPLPLCSLQVNNACSTGSTALLIAKQLVEGGEEGEGQAVRGGGAGGRRGRGRGCRGML